VEVVMPGGAHVIIRLDDERDGKNKHLEDGDIVL
jgi:hypothetical protein